MFAESQTFHSFGNGWASNSRLKRFNFARVGMD